ncbi:MAG: T9SS type A sorting domain-containing protein [Bacteroidetes bacterium]|nr:T9SS type A sorting domain-containing protein [Bacteroidota bacterium]
MKKILLSIGCALIATSLTAKKVKFAVDMAGQIVNSTGVHVIGDFQTAAGLGPDLDPSTATLTQEGATTIYSLIVDIPAFQKYEYKFVNGDLSYEVEIVPDAAQVGYNFNDNRWLYVDSLANDTTYVGAILFGGSAPAGKNLIRYKVDISNLSVPAYGVHVGTNYNNFLPYKTRLYSFGSGVYEIINYLDNGTYLYNYINGKTLSDIETSVPSSCSSSGTRSITLNKDSVLPVVCFNYCTDCASVGVHELTSTTSVFKLFPNPVRNSVTFQSTSNEEITSIGIYDISGKKVKDIPNIKASSYSILYLGLAKGIYTVNITNTYKQQQHLKLIVD